MQKLENNEYLEKYTEYKNEMNTDLTILLQQKKDLLKELINGNIYIQTIKKYNKEIDKNKNNINQLFNHFINMYTNYAKDNYSYQNDFDLIDNLQKLQQVIKNINNESYISQFDSLISSRFYEDPNLNGNGTSLKESAWKLIITYDIRKTKYGKGVGDAMIMQNLINKNAKCYNKIEQYLIGDTDENKFKNYNNLMKYIRSVYNTDDYNTEDYYNDILTYFKPGTPLSDFENWIKTCIIPDNN